MFNQERMLRINLTDEKILKEPVSEELCRKYLGGEGINSRLLWEHFLHVDPKLDPLSSDNVLILGIGPLASTGLGAGSKMKFTFKSPAYNIYGDTSCGGGFGSELRWSGYDHIVITGEARRPVYLWINDDSVEIRDASHLWGKNAHETDDAIKEELGSEYVKAVCIGQAGENLVRVASVMADGHRAGGRGGGGCVFGSKNLKAIAALGTRGLQINNPDKLFKAINDFIAAENNNPRRVERHMRYGTLVMTRGNVAWGFNTFRNGMGMNMPDDAADKLDHHWYANNIGARALACSPGCVFGCGSWYHLKGHESPAARRYAGEWGTKPEYGAANPFGAACDIRDMPAIGHLTKMCNQYGMDVMEVSMSIAFLMELWERDIITEADTKEWYGEPLPLDWGNFISAEKVIDAIGLQRNRLGEMLDGGVYQAARRISELKGVDVLKYACYGKGGATHEGPARFTKLGMACALTSIGAHHTKGLGIAPATSMAYFGKPDAGDILGTNLKGCGQAVGETLVAVGNSLGVCMLIVDWGGDVISLDFLTSALEAVTGTRLSSDELFTAGERVVNIQKAFNSRLGLRREHDSLCERWMNEPLLEGKARGMKASNFLEPAKDEYYQYRGWDKATALQTKKKLAELDMLDVAQVLEKENAII